MRFVVISLSLWWTLLAIPVWAGEHIAVVTRASAVKPSCSKAELARIYLRKKSWWDDGTRITPVNFPADHPLRRSFSLAVLGALPEELETYWNDQYFHGVMPPHILTSEEAVIRFVASTPGAIGYVTEGAVTKEVQVLLLLPPDIDTEKATNR